MKELFAVFLCAVSLAGCGAVYGQQGGATTRTLDNPYGVTLPGLQGCGLYEDSGSGTLTCIDPHYRGTGTTTVPGVVTTGGECGYPCALKREPFDVAPQQWAVYEWRWNKSCDMGSCIENPAMGSHLEEVKHEACADPHRVPLTSEDQVKHCFDFSRLGDAR